MRISDWSSDVCSSDLALTEIAKVQAHSHHLLDVRHGPMVTVGPRTLVIAALSDEGDDYQHKLMRDIQARGAKIIAFGEHRSEERRVGKECVSTFRSRWSPDH